VEPTVATSRLSKPESATRDATIVFSHRPPILVQFVIAKFSGLHVPLFTNDGVHAVTSALSQMNCNIVSVTKQIRYAPMISQETAFTIDSLLAGLGHERV
jgi:hypothetical protein